MQYSLFKMASSAPGILAYKALNGMHQIYTLLNMKTEADSVRTRLDLFHSAFNHTFYNKETPTFKHTLHNLTN